jgi:hypothetical protein
MRSSLMLAFEASWRHLYISHRALERVPRMAQVMNLFGKKSLANQSLIAYGRSLPHIMPRRRYSRTDIRDLQMLQPTYRSLLRNCGPAKTHHSASKTSGTNIWRTISLLTLSRAPKSTSFSWTPCLDNSNPRRQPRPEAR